MAFGLTQWIMVHTSAWVLWGCIVHALHRDLLRDSSCKKCVLSLVSCDEERSTGVLEQCGCSSDVCASPILWLSGTACSSLWSPLFCHTAGPESFITPVLEWQLPGHLAGWHHIRARLTSPCFSGVILVGCGWCLLPLASSQQGLAQPAAPFLNSYLA